MKASNEGPEEMAQDLISDELLEDLAHDRLDEDEAAFLRALAEGDDENEARVAAYAPIDEAQRRTLADKLAWRLRVERRQRRVRGALASGVMLAAAAAAALVVLPSHGDPELPGYHVDLGAGARSERGGSQDVDVPHFTATTRLELVLRPEARVEGPISIAGWLRGPGAQAHLQRWPVNFEIAEGGSIRVVGEAQELLPTEPGEYTLHVIVARHLPDVATQRAWVEANDPRVLSEPLVLTP